MSSTSVDTGTDRVAAALHRARQPMRLRAQPANSPTRRRMEAVLRVLPVHSFVGRRDRALLVLTCAGFSYRHLARLTRTDVSIGESTAIIDTHAGSLTMQQTADGKLCGPCGLARWVHILDLTVIHAHSAVIASIIARSVPLTFDSLHLCEGNVADADVVNPGPLFPPIDPWGHLAVTPGPRDRDRVDNLAELEHRALDLQHRVEHLLDDQRIDAIHPVREKGRG